MIIQNISNIIPPTGNNDGSAVLLDVNNIELINNIEENSVCICKCEYVESVFSENGTITDWNKNDKTTLLFKKALTTDTITIKLIHNSIDYVITDDTYGTYYGGTLTANTLYYGFIADWNKIYNSLGSGSYYFEITTNIIGQTNVLETIKYNLQLYSDSQADNTIRIETYNTGNIISNSFNYSNLLPNGWYQSFRIKGKLLPKIPKLTTDNYINASNVITQIQDKITNEYELVLGLIPSSISDVIIYDNLLADRILISDYNVFNEDVKRQIELRPTDIEKKYFNYNTMCQFNIKFIESKDNIIKNNN